MPKKKGDHDGAPLPSAIEVPTKKKKDPKDALDSALDVPPGVLPPDPMPKK